MKLPLYVFTKTRMTTITFERYDYSEIRLTPRIARRAAVITKLTPCWVTDGTKTYRVTRGSIVPKDLYRLPFYLITNLMAWYSERNDVPDHFIQL